MTLGLFGLFFFLGLTQFLSKGAIPKKRVLWVLVATTLFGLSSLYFIQQDSREGEQLEADFTLQVVCGDGYQVVHFDREGVGLVGLERNGQVQFTYTRFSGTITVEQREELYLPRGVKTRIDLYAMEAGGAESVPRKTGRLPLWQGSYLVQMVKKGQLVGDKRIGCVGKSGESIPLIFNTMAPSAFSTLMSDLRNGGHDRLSRVNRDSLIQKGRQVYQRRCAACHGDQGQGSVVIPGLSRNRTVQGPFIDHLAAVLWGKPKTAMKPFYNQLDFVELAAVMSFQRASWSSHDKESIQPAIIAGVILSSPRSKPRF